MVTHLVEDVQVVLQRVAASGGSAIVGDKRDIVGARLARTGAAHDGVGRLVIMRFRFCHSMSVSRCQRTNFESAHSLKFVSLSPGVSKVVKVDAAVTRALVVGQPSERSQAYKLRQVKPQMMK